MKKDKALISVNSLSRFYGKKRAIENISFDVHKGEIVGLLGPNGAGKSTTMQIICGVIAANNGSVSIAGYDIHDAPKQAKQHPQIDELSKSSAWIELSSNRANLLIYFSALFCNRKAHITFTGRNFVDSGKNCDFMKNTRFGVHRNMAFSQSQILQIPAKRS